MCVRGSYGSPETQLLCVFLDGVPTMIPESLGYRHQYVLSIIPPNLPARLLIARVQCQRVLAIPGTA
jgi:hypothetical protein